MNREEFISAALERPPYWGYSGGLDLSHWGRTGFSLTRDSDLVVESNWAQINLEIAENDSFSVERSRHWAVGWIKELFVDTQDLAAVDLVMALHQRLEDYPLLDEEAYSELEWNDWLDQFDSWGQSDLFAAIGWPDSDEIEDRMGEIMLEVWKDHRGYSFDDIVTKTRDAIMLEFPTCSGCDKRHPWETCPVREVGE